jgi:hypothetical protein
MGLDDASWSFFVFFSQDGMFMALALWRRSQWCVRERRQRAPAYKALGSHRPRRA